ncbi:MAG: zeta toxin family protein [Paludibacteraceae bacterium]|nr:zeta toxin family protein [Paludibacteraceae bacterium]
MAEKNLYIISGCNGAGKTTASYSVLPTLLDCKQFVNADEIAKGLSPFCPESVAIQSGKLMLLRIEELLSADETFSIETTLATRSYSELVKRAQEKGYKVTLLYFWLSSPELAVERVARRVSEGGHNIPKDVIYRRYEKGLKNLFDIFIPIVDSWMIVDNGVEPREVIAKGTKAGMETFNNLKLDKMKKYGR